MDKSATSSRSKKPSVSREEENIPSNPVSLGSSSEAASLPDTQATSPTSSSSYDLLADTDSAGEGDGSDRIEKEKIREGQSVERKRVATDSEQVQNMVEIVVIDSEEYEMETRGSSGQASRRDMDRTSGLLEEIASEAVKEMHGIKRKRKGKQIETQDGADAGDEEATVTAEWRKRMEETVNGLVAENATQRTLVKELREQMIKVIDLVGRLISWIERRFESSHQHPIPVPTPLTDQPQEASPDTTPARTVMKRKLATTTTQPPAAEPASSSAKWAKLARGSGSQGSQKKN